MSGYYKKTERYSFSKLNTFIQCPFKYYLKYVLGNFIDTSGLAAYFGSLVHHIEESIGNSIKNGEVINYDQLKEEFYNINRPKKDKHDISGDIFGINILKTKFKNEFYKIDAKGQSYATKAENYANVGIYRLENFMNNNPNLEIFSTEHHFEIEFHNVILTGSIDRILRDKNTGEFIIEDIKTKDKFFSEEETVTPLQAVIYSIALKSIANLNDFPATFRYDLPIVGARQSAGTKGFVKRGCEKIVKILEQIHSLESSPKPCPLCYYCEFKNAYMCPYHSLWTPEHKTFSTSHEWAGLENHNRILEEYKNSIKQLSDEEFDF